MLQGNVLITGGAGFLGRGIMHVAKRDHWPCKFTVYSRSEEKQAVAAQRYKARYVLGDILDTPRLALLMTGHDTVIHAAALKFIPECEANPSECVRVNVDGTRSVMDAARIAGVSTVVIISTDKAPNPENIYGMTKAITERLVGETYNSPEATRFVACRYGNVIGSTGSVWPVWKRQAANDGVIRLTSPDMSRYMMTIEQAVDVVVSAASTHTPTGVVVIDPTRAIQMRDAATAAAAELGVEVEHMGVRPGEKMHEQMISASEAHRLQMARPRRIYSAEDSLDVVDYHLLPVGEKITEEFRLIQQVERFFTSALPMYTMTGGQWVDAAKKSEVI